MTHIAHNLRYLRHREGITQTQLAEALGLNRPVIGAYEESRAEPRAEVLVAMAHYFDVPVEHLISRKLPVRKSKTAGDGPQVLAIAVDSHTQRELVPLVPAKAAAGYLNGFADPEFIAELPLFALPFSELSRERTHRIFQIKGDSMLPVPDGAYIIGSYVENMTTLKAGRCYIWVTGTEGIVYKRMGKSTGQKLVLLSDNEAYDPIEISPSEVREVWEAKGFVSFELP